MGVARNTFYLEIRQMGNVALVVPAWDKGLTHSLVCCLLRKKKKKRGRLSSQISNLAAQSCVCMCRLAHGCFCLGRGWLVSAAVSYMEGRRSSISATNSHINKGMWGKKKSYFVLFAFTFSYLDRFFRGMR